MFSFLRNKRGFSLVELMITLAILLIVLAVGYQFFFFGTRSYAIGENQSNVQRDIRIVSDFITKEIRNATKVSLVSSSESNTSEYIYLETKDIKHRLGAAITNKTNGNIENLAFSLQQTLEGNNVVEFTVVGREGDQNYDITTRVHLNNIRGQLDLSPPPSTAGLAIKYEKP